jgi:hypothetical protein
MANAVIKIYGPQGSGREVLLEMIGQTFMKYGLTFSVKSEDSGDYELSVEANTVKLTGVQ